VSSSAYLAVEKEKVISSLTGVDPEQNLTGSAMFDWGPFFYEIGEFKHFSFIICTNTK
jgi:hypothetical protein